jgi:hypothetical protein
MKSTSVRMFAFACALGLVAGAVACGGTDSPAAPSPTPTPVVTLKVEAPVPRTPITGQQLDTLRPALSVANAVITGNVGTVTYEFEVSEMETFPVGSRTSSEKGIVQGEGTTSWVPPSNLVPNLKYFWRARAAAANVANPTDWSSTETFRTQIRGFVIPGQELYDPLTNGATIGSRIGGHFVTGQGWQADSDSDAIFYDFGSCTSCTLELDVTNFGRAVGASREKDYKWITMGDAPTFGSFFTFRDHLWKMHLEQRSDGDGTGMKLVWRNGDDGTGVAGGADSRNDTTVDWRSNLVYRFTLRWTPANYSVRVAVVNTDGSLSSAREWFSGSFGGRAFAPPTLRISLGCYPRAETMTGAIWRNVHVVKN